MMVHRREAARPSNASITGMQRFGGARVYMQGVVVASTVSIYGLIEVLEASRRLKAERRRDRPASGVADDSDER